MRTRLIIMRHAKSSWSNASLDDHDRPLNERGRRDAPRIAQELLNRDWIPDRIRVSSSKRTIETLELMKVISLNSRIDVEPSLYHSNISTLLQAVEQIEEGAEADEDIGDDFENLYKGEISKSGTPILPSKRARKAPEKIQVSKDDLAELSQTAQPTVDTTESVEEDSSSSEVSLEEVSKSETETSQENSEDSEASNS